MLCGRTLACLVGVTIAGCGGGDSSAPLRPLASLPAPPPAGAQELWETNAAAQTMSSRWFLDLAGEPVTVSLTAALDGTHASGSAVGGSGVVEVVDNVSWDAVGGVLDFRRVTSGVAEWVHARAVEGVVTGRVAYDGLGDPPPAELAAWEGHVVGWNERYFSRDLVPRVFDLEVGGERARLRLDRDGGGALVGRFKVYADETTGNAAEAPEEDVDVQAWDGRTLAFRRVAGADTQTFGVTVDGATLAGIRTSSVGDAPANVDGTRVELLAFGLSPREAAARDDWQAHARRQLAHLMMADNPAPLSLSVTRTPAAIEPTGAAFAADRDDDADDWPAGYAVDELAITATLADPYGGPPLTRALHGFVTTPAGDAPPGGWPALVVVNGHDGSARGMLDPYDPLYWYGDAWARRGWVVLALDVGHRPLADRAALYKNYANGDRPADGNGTHPAIRAAALDSDWVEDGERTWDVSRAVDLVATLAGVDPARIAVTGLSMGGEVATFAGALDPRIAAIVPAGFVPDLPVMALNGNHPCWRWLAGDPTDYFSVSDLHALVAPRALVAETGAADGVFSKLAPPFVDGKEVARRSSAAYAGAAAGNFVVYLHPGGHEYRFGDIDATGGSGPLYVTAPTDDAPASGATVSLGVTLPDLLLGYVPAP